MKLNRFLSVFLFGLGCMFIFIGIAAAILPGIQNAQLQLVLSTFQMPADNFLVNIINHGMSYALQNSFLVMGIGGGLVFAGVVLMLIARPAQTTAVLDNQRKPEAPQPSPKSASKQHKTEDVYQWRPTKIPQPVQSNPFADTSLSALLMPKSTDKQHATNASAIAVYTPIIQTNPQPPFDSSSATPYARPVMVSNPPSVQSIQQEPIPIAPIKSASFDSNTIPMLLRDQTPAAIVQSVPKPAPQIIPPPQEQPKPAQIRSTFAAKPAAEETVKPVPDMPIPSNPAPASRIKSTMGKHH
ncbi:MAG: hypothetical protein GX096_04640 [Clostridiales bacterium]|nr:hypothetical protein [Clostridiales bacterium]